jgi:hypothetical protein
MSDRIGDAGYSDVKNYQNMNMVDFVQAKLSEHMYSFDEANIKNDKNNQGIWEIMETKTIHEIEDRTKKS